MKQIDKFEKLLTQSTAASGAVVVGTLAATAAFAAPIDSLVITDINVTLNDGEETDNFYNLDLDGNGSTDFVLGSNTTSEQGKPDFEFGFIKTQGLTNGILTTGKYFLPFEAGDEVPGMNKFLIRQEASLYDHSLGLDGSGPLGAIGATAYIGLVMNLELDDEDHEANGQVGALATALVAEVTGPTYGWVEVERGSLKVLRSGYQPIAGLAAPIPGGVPAVPVPATLPLLLTGAAGLAALRRRNKKAA